MTSPVRRAAPTAAVVAVGAVSVANGVGEVTLGTRVHDVTAVLGLSAAAMGLVLAAFSAGLLVGGLVVSVVIDRVGTRVCMVTGAGLFFGSLAVIGVVLASGGHSAGASWLGPLWGLAGVGCGLMDPAHAAVAAHGEAHGGPPVQAYLAAKVAATAAGALLGGVAVGLGVGVGSHLIVVGGVALAVAVLASAVLRPIYGVRAEDDIGPDIGRRGLVMLGCLAGAAVVPLGAALTWGTTLLVEIGARPWLIGSGVVAFALAQLVGLLVTLALRRRVRPLPLLVGGCAVAGGGVVALALVAHPALRPVLPLDPVAVAAVGLALLGVGIAPIPAVVQMAAHRVRAARVRSTTRVALVTVGQYTWQAIGPALIGGVGASVGVWWAFVGVAGVCVIAIPCGWPLLRHAGP